MNEHVQKRIHEIKSLIMKKGKFLFDKGNCKDVFAVMCGFELELQKNFNNLTNEKKSF